jgi:hypothetical protein
VGVDGVDGEPSVGLLDESVSSVGVVSCEAEEIVLAEDEGVGELVRSERMDWLESL